MPTHRYWCTVLDEMREMHKAHNYAQLPAYIEELQTLGNRMESALSEKRDLECWHGLAKKEEKKYKKLLKKVKKLRKEVGEKPGNNNNWTP